MAGAAYARSCVQYQEFSIEVDRFRSMEVFVATVNRGSFTAAARAFRITPSMVGKHIRALEERLEARLLTLERLCRHGGWAGDCRIVAERLR